MPAIIDRVNQLLSDSLARQISEEGTINHSHYKLHQPMRPGKSVDVLFLDIQKQDSLPLHCVLRKDTKDGAAYLQYIQQAPFIKECAPHLYAMQGEWVIMERLVGLELHRLTDRLKSDEDFLNSYVESVYTLMCKLAESSIVSKDLRFRGGYNCIVNPETAAIRIIEQGALRPDLVGYSSKEIIIRSLVNELEDGRANIRQEVNDENLWEFRYNFKLAQQVLRSIGSELSVRPVMIKPSNSNFRSTYDAQFSFDIPPKKLSDEEFGLILQKNVFELVFEAGYSLSDEFIESVRESDFETFTQIVASRKFKKPLESSIQTEKIVLS